MQSSNLSSQNIVYKPCLKHPHFQPSLNLYFSSLFPSFFSLVFHSLSHLISQCSQVPYPKNFFCLSPHYLLLPHLPLIILRTVKHLPVQTPLLRPSSSSILQPFHSTWLCSFRTHLPGEYRKGDLIAFGSTHLRNKHLQTCSISVSFSDGKDVTLLNTFQNSHPNFHFQQMLILIACSWHNEIFPFKVYYSF